MKINPIDHQDAALKSLVALVRTKDSHYWERAGEQTALALFHRMAEDVPAYKDFLKKRKFRPANVRTARDLLSVPPTSKENYLNVYPYEQLLWRGTLRQPLTIHSTSGTTGTPRYFYRNVASDFKRRLIIDNFLKYNPDGPTLFIIALGMGVWSAGVGVYTGAYLSTKLGSHPVSIITPGVNKTETLKILKTIAPHYKQVVISAYPPLAKDIIDEATEEGIDLKKLNLRFFFTGEAFTEGFRDYLKTKGYVHNVLTDTISIYGTSELGPTAVETPLTILIRRLLDKKAFNGLFGDIKKTPTLAQYIPHLVNLECVDGEIYFTGDEAIPLMRYQSGDHGGVFSYDRVQEMLRECGINLQTEIKRAGISRHVSELPMVYVYERKNLVTTLYGALIYPEYLKETLLDRTFHDYLTGKFTLLQKYDRKQNQYIEINMELRRNVKPTKSLDEAVRKKVVAALKQQSSEFSELAKNLGERVYPKLVFWSYEHPEHFAPGTKQRWVKK